MCLPRGETHIIIVSLICLSEGKTHMVTPKGEAHELAVSDPGNGALSLVVKATNWMKESY